MSMFGRSRQAGGREHDRDALTATFELGVEQAGEQLQRDVLECERRAVEQLEQPGVRAELDERTHRGMVERRVGLGRCGRELSAADTVDEWPDDLGSGVRIGRLGRDRWQCRPGLRNVQPAVGGEPGEHDVDEVENRSGPASAHVLHGSYFTARC
jgi:hypothetical protein